MAISSHDVWPLLKALGAPDQCVEFHLIAKVGAAVMCQATFYAPKYELYEIWTFDTGQDGNAALHKEVKPKMITERYHLTKIEDVPNGQQS